MKHFFAGFLAACFIAMAYTDTIAGGEEAVSADPGNLSTATVSDAAVAEVADQTVAVWKTGRITAAALIVAMAICVLFLAGLSIFKRRRAPSKDNPHSHLDDA